MERRTAVLHSLQAGPDATIALLQIAWNFRSSNHLEDGRYRCVVSQLDLVCVDTAHHLAGALDVPVWIMLQHNADFRWMRGRSDSPWYRSMTLIRQQKLGDWDNVLQQIQNNLVRLLGPATSQVDPG